MKSNESKRHGENIRSGQEVAKQSGQAPISKARADYWQRRLFKPSYTRNGTRFELADYAARIQYLGRRETFVFSPNAAKSAEEARKVHGFLEANGWPATLAKFKPKAEAPKKAAKVGEVIAAAETVATVRPRTLAVYASSLRLIAAELAGIKGNVSRFAYKTPAFTEWRASVDAVPLSVFTPGAIAEWRARRVAAHSSDPVAKRSAEITADAVVRSARGLFGRDLASLIRRTVILPDPLPFAGISLVKSTRRFRADVSAEWLFNVAKTDLEAKHPEEFKALVLCLLAGLRRAEADCLTWAQIDLGAARISIRETPYFAPKSEDSTREIDLSPDAVGLLRRFKATPKPDPVFVLNGGRARPLCKFKYYRADCQPHGTWRKLAAWLVSKGITAKKPIHALRKHAGSLIHARYGIEAARGFLGHSDIGTTSASYVEKRPRVAVTLEEPENDFAQRTGEAK